MPVEFVFEIFLEGGEKAVFDLFSGTNVDARLLLTIRERDSSYSEAGFRGEVAGLGGLRIGAGLALSVVILTVVKGEA